MIDYTVGDKVVCIDDKPVDFLKIMRYRVQDFQYPLKGEVYTVRDIAAPELFVERMTDNSPGVLLEEITAGSGEVNGNRDELWYSASSFRKALPSDLAAQSTRQHQPA